jgi:poly(3-hydroxybutyrate) depolymerase
MTATENTTRLRRYQVEPGKSSISGLSSGAFMTVQLHLAHSSQFCGAGIVAGGPYRCAESFRDAAFLTEDAFEQSAINLCMNPLTPHTAPNAEHLARLASATAGSGKINQISNLAGHRIYIFTGSNDNVVASVTVAQTRRFYELLGVNSKQIAYQDTSPAGHALLTNNPEDSPLCTNQPPWLNYGRFMQSHAILKHIHDDLQPASDRLTGRLLRFDQTEFSGNDPRACMSKFGYVYVPYAVEKGAPARVHIALHGCKQGHDYVNFVHGRPDSANQPPYGNRYITTTGYNQIADSNNIIVLYPQVEGRDDEFAQNPDGCWDWWGYSSPSVDRPDYYSQNAIQIKAIYGMLSKLGGW